MVSRDYFNREPMILKDPPSERAFLGSASRRPKMS